MTSYVSRGLTLIVVVAASCAIASDRAYAQQPIDLAYYYSQNDPAWKGNPLGDSFYFPLGPTVGSDGCTLTVAAMLMANCGLVSLGPGVGLDPASLNAALRDSRSGFLCYVPVGGNVCLRHTVLTWDVLAGFTKRIAAYNGGAYLEHRNRTRETCCTAQDDARCEEAIASFYTSSGYPLPIRVSTGSCHSHSVVLLGQDEIGFWYQANPAPYPIPLQPTIMPGGTDPYWDQLDVVVPSYAPHPASQPSTNRAIAPDAALSAGLTQMRLSYPPGAHYLVVDPLGRRWGVDSLNVSYAEIPNAGILDLDINTNDDPDRPGVPPEGGGSIFVVDAPTIGPYRIISSGAAGTGYAFALGVSGADGGEVTIEASGTFPSSGTAHYSRAFSAGPSVATTVGGDGVALVDKLAVPLASDLSLYCLFDLDLSAGIYLQPPGGGGSYHFDPALGSRVLASGNVSGVGATRMLAASLLNGLPSLAGGNHNPRATPDQKTTAGSATLVFPSRDLVANDADADNDSLRVLAVTPTPDTRGSATLTADSVRFTPEQGFVGTTRFVYSVGDGRNGLAAAVVNVVVASSVGVDPIGTPALALGRISPNPSGGEMRVNFTLHEAAPASLQLVDVLGRKVVEMNVGAFGPGQHVVTLAPKGNLGPGVYFLRLSQGSERATQRVTWLR